MTAPRTGVLGALLAGALLSASPHGVRAQVAPAADTATTAPEEWRDAWGQPKNFGLAAAETYMGNFLPWLFNETVPSRVDLLISQLSPRSWWRNIRNGWEWDDNSFQVNQFAHPFQGGIYYNSARSNGFSYWTSLAFALAGSFDWECCGETHLMSINDWANTSLGGAAVGEMLYRTSSMVLDNEARGGERVAREAVAFLLAPTRGFTRLVTGNAGRVYENPLHPSDRIPNRLEAAFSSGVRGGASWRTARGGTLRGDVPSHGFLDVKLVAGDLATLDRQVPFDYIDVHAQINLIKGRGLGRLGIQGNLWHWDLDESERFVSKVLLTQDFEYENNTAFEQGGQGVGLSYFMRAQPSESVTIRGSIGPTWLIMGGVQSELAFLAQVQGIREGFREYDFGMGPGLRMGLDVTRDGRRMLEGSYRLEHMHTLNGSTVEGLGSSHRIQVVRVRGVLPFDWHGIGVGAEYEYFKRRSDFDIADVGLVVQRAYNWQAFVTWNPLRRLR